MLEFLACLAPALALSAHRMGRLSRRVFAPVLGLQLMVIAAGAAISGLGTPVEEVWTRHSFFSVLASQPWVLMSFLVICLALSVLAQRIWEEPSLSGEKRHHESRGTFESMPKIDSK